jgi:hypothetical protein
MTTEIIPQQYEKFNKLVLKGIEAWVEAGKMLVEMQKTNPNVSKEICAAYPSLSPAVIAKFEAIGRGTLNPQLLLSESPGVRKLRAMPISVQNHLEGGSVDLLVLREKGVDVMKVEIKNLTQSQAAQVFGRYNVRDLAAQRAWLEDKQTRSKFISVTSSLPYKLKGDVILFNANCQMTRTQLRDILASW